jgi:hypothetical protein
VHASLQAVACGSAALRMVNLLFGAACLPLFYAVHRELHADTSTANSFAVVSCHLLCTRSCPIPHSNVQLWVKVKVTESMPDHCICEE